jgi:hypothetical protein
MLSKPVTYRGKVYDRVNLREPTAAQMEMAERELDFADGSVTVLNMRRYQIAFIAVVARVPRPVVMAMRARDFQRATDYLAAFMFPPDEPKAITPPRRRRRKPPKLRLVTAP